MYDYNNNQINPVGPAQALLASIYLTTYNNTTQTTSLGWGWQSAIHVW